MNRIVISGYYGFDNLGDEAILSSIIQSLYREDDQLEITVLSADPETTSKRYGVSAISRTNPRSIIDAVSNCDLFLSGGGSLLQDVTSSRTIPYYLGLVLLAQMMGKKTVFYAQGIGPVSGKINQKLIKWIGSRTDLITVRDRDSAILLERVGIDPIMIEETVDPVFSFNPDQLVKHRPEICDQLESQKTVGISVRPWGDNSYLDQVARAGDFMADISGGRVVIVPLYPDQDLEACRRVQEEMDHTARLLEDFYPPREMINLIGCFDFFLGVRFHSLIFAALNQIPMVGISYDPKVDSLLNMLNLETGLSTEHCPYQRLQEWIREYWGRRRLIEEQLAQSMAQFRETARENTVRILNLLEE